MDGDTLGEKDGDEGAAGEESWIGDIGLLRLCGSGLAGERRGEEKLEEMGEIDGDRESLDDESKTALNTTAKDEVQRSVGHLRRQKKEKEESDTAEGSS